MVELGTEVPVLGMALEPVVPGTALEPVEPGMVPVLEADGTVDMMAVHGTEDMMAVHGTVETTDNGTETAEDGTEMLWTTVITPVTEITTEKDSPNLEPPADTQALVLEDMLVDTPMEELLVVSQPASTPIPAPTILSATKECQITS